MGYVCANCGNWWTGQHTCPVLMTVTGALVPNPVVVPSPPATPAEPDHAPECLMASDLAACNAARDADAGVHLSWCPCRCHADEWAQIHARWREERRVEEIARARRVLAEAGEPDAAALRAVLLEHDYLDPCSRQSVCACGWDLNPYLHSSAWTQWVDHVLAARAASTEGETQ